MVPLSVAHRSLYVADATPGAAATAQVTAGRAEVPPGLRTPAAAVPVPRRAAAWSVPPVRPDQVRQFTGYVD